MGLKNNKIVSMFATVKRHSKNWKIDRPAFSSVHLLNSLSNTFAETRHQQHLHPGAESSHSCQDLPRAFHLGHHRLPPPYLMACSCLPHLLNRSCKTFNITVWLASFQSLPYIRPYVIASSLKKQFPWSPLGTYPHSIHVSIVLIITFLAVCHPVIQPTKSGYWRIYTKNDKYIAKTQKNKWMPNNSL